MSIVVCYSSFCFFVYSIFYSTLSCLLFSLTVAIVTTILKEFFIGAPSSLLPEENYSSFISVAGTEMRVTPHLLNANLYISDSRQFTLEGIRDQLTNIPLSHQRVLHRLLIFFRSVCIYSRFFPFSLRLSLPSISIFHEAFH